MAQNGLTPAMIDKHIRMVRSRFGFNVEKVGSRKGKYNPPATMPDIIFIEERKKSTSTTSSVTPAKPSISMSIPTTDTSTETTDTMEQTIGMATISEPKTSSEGGGQLPVISAVYSMSMVGETEDPEEEEASEVELVSTVTQHLVSYDPKENLSSQDLRIKREMFDNDLQPGHPRFI